MPEVQTKVKVTEEGSVEVESLGKKFEQLETTSKKATSNMTSGFSALRGSIVTIASIGVIGKLVSGMRSSLDASIKLQNSLLGLSSVARSMGANVELATQAAQDLAKDGLMSVADASASLKNLLVKGYGLPEAIALMNRFKDAAAFGRQGQLSLGEAVRGATEGLKNEMSTLVDNAGVTKNLSIMWKDYAKEIGKTVGKLTEAEKRQAVYQGIMKETLPFLGDAERLTEQYSGKTSKLNESFFRLKATIGTQLQPTMLSLVTATNKNVIAFDDWIKKTDAVGKAGITLNSTLSILGKMFSFNMVEDSQALVQSIMNITDALTGFKNAAAQPFISPDRLLGEKPALVEDKKPTAPKKEVINKKTEDLRAKLAIDRMRIIANAEKDFFSRRKGLMEADIKAFTATTTDEVAIAQFRNNALLQLSLDMEARKGRISKETEDLRTRLAINRMRIIANAEKDFFLKRKGLAEADMKAFAATTNDEVAIAQHRNNLLLQLSLDMKAREEQIEQEKAEKRREIWRQAQEDFEEAEKARLAKIEQGQKQELEGARIVAAARLKWDKQQAAQKIELARMQQQAITGTFSFIGNSALAQSKATFNISKAANIAQAFMNTQTAATNALANIPAPFNFAAAAAVVAAGLANVRAIASTSFGGGVPSGGGGKAASIKKEETIKEATPMPVVKEFGTINLYVNGVPLEIDKDKFARDVMPNIIEAFEARR